MANYKALENKALHQGNYIAWVVDRGEWTTNGHIMVRGYVDTKPLKNQQDMRDVVRPVDIISRVKAQPIHKLGKNIDEWENLAGLKLTRVTSPSTTISVQSIYLDYINAKFDITDWYTTEMVVIARDAQGIAAIISKVNEENIDESNGTTRGTTSTTGTRRGVSGSEQRKQGA